VTRDTLLHRPEAIKRFLKATFEGWRAYLSDPSLAQVAIRDANPAMTEEQLAYGYTKLKAMGVIDGGDAKTLGLGIITDARFKATYDFLIREGLLKPEVDYHDAFDESLIKDLHIQ
jgi:NitT/TauT family transport system substrate-binding protein